VISVHLPYSKRGVFTNVNCLQKINEYCLERRRIVGREKPILVVGDLNVEFTNETGLNLEEVVGRAATQLPGAMVWKTFPFRDNCKIKTSKTIHGKEKNIDHLLVYEHHKTEHCVKYIPLWDAKNCLQSNQMPSDHAIILFEVH
jgi:endonuclease/exonuclease/phosphatase family metal-dependent hydrolase